VPDTRSNPFPTDDVVKNMTSATGGFLAIRVNYGVTSQVSFAATKKSLQCNVDRLPLFPKVALADSEVALGYSGAYHRRFLASIVQKPKFTADAEEVDHDASGGEKRPRLSQAGYKKPNASGVLA
jgi:hypothetical protein